MIDYEQDYLNSNTGSNQLSSFVESEVNLFYTPAPAVNILGGVYNRTITNYEWHGYYNINAGPNFRNFLTTIVRPYMFNAVFLQGTSGIGERLTLVAGFRLEQSTPFDIRRVNDLDTLSIVRTYTYDYTNINLLPRLALIYAADDNHIVKFMYGTAIKQPSMASLQPYPLHPDWGTLKPSTISTYEINYLSHASRFLTANISVFYNDIQNLIARKDITKPDGTIIIESSNAGRMHSTGVELGVKVTPSDKFTLNVSGSYQHSKDRTDGMDTVDLGYSPAFLGYGEASYRIDQHVTLAVTYRFVDKMYSYYENTSDFTGRIGSGSPAYSVVDMNVSVSEIVSNVSASFRISNIFDTEIRYPTTLAGSNWDKGTVGTPRMAFVTIGYTFH
jgi:outer membrane receptor protein involved in Fe transport